MGIGDEPCRLHCRHQALADAARAITDDPTLAGRVFVAFAEEILALKQKYAPRVPDLPLSQAFCEHYASAVRYLLHGIFPADAAPQDNAIAAAVCSVAFLLAVRVPMPAGEKVTLPPMSEDALLDTLTFLSSNLFGKPYGVSETLTEIVQDVLTRGQVDAELEIVPAAAVSVKEQMQEVLFYTFLLLGGPTPEVVYSEVERARRGKKPPRDIPPLGVSDEELVRLYDENERLFGQGLWIESLAEAMREESRAKDVVEGLRGRWLDLFLFLIPYVWPPAMATGALLPARPAIHELWVSASAALARRLRWRYGRRERRAWKKLGVELDAQIGREGTWAGDSVPITWGDRVTKTWDGEVVLPRRRDWQGWHVSDRPFEFLEGLGLTKRERQVAELLSEGYKPVDIAAALGLTKGGVSQIVAGLAEKLKKKPRA